MVHVFRNSNWLHMTFPCQHDFMGWTVYGGGSATGRTVSWRCVLDEEVQNLHTRSDVKGWIEEQVRSSSPRPDAVFLTSCDLSLWQTSQWIEGSTRATCYTTVGLGNALSLGSTQESFEIGTINIMVQINKNLSFEAKLELLSVVSQARTAALHKANLTDQKGQRLIGTGTDCSLLAALPEGPLCDYAGLHTEVGRCVLRAVQQAVSAGAEAWYRRYSEKLRTKPASPSQDPLLPTHVANRTA